MKPLSEPLVAFDFYNSTKFLLSIRQSVSVLRLHLDTTSTEVRVFVLARQDCFLLHNLRSVRLITINPSISPASEHSDAKNSVALRRLVYRSEATAEFHMGSINEILASSHKNNAEYSVTGFLIHAGNGFVQMLEGPSESIDVIYFKKICSDQHHTNLRVIVDRPINERRFSQWWMASLFLDGEHSVFGGTADRDMCRSVSKELLAKYGESERLVGRYLMLLDLLPFRNVKWMLQ